MTWPPPPDDAHVRAFLGDIADNPDDPGVRLVFADWLEERDDPRAELLRMQADYLREEAFDRCSEIEARAAGWLEKYGKDWIGELPPPSNGYAFSLASDLLEVMSYLAETFLDRRALRGLRERLNEGWVRHFRLTCWDHEQIEQAAELGLLDGPGELDILGGDCRDATLRYFGAATQMRHLSLGGSNLKISDKGLARLAGLTRLRELSLWSLADITGSGLKHLTANRRLRRLSLYNCDKFGDVALNAITTFAELEKLSLSKCGELTGANLDRLTGLLALWELDLSQCPRLDDAGLARLAGLTGLRQLTLSCCEGITNAGVAGLAGLSGLERLNLYGCAQITGAGVIPLRVLKNLKWLGLVDCKLKPHETRALRKALPECEVVRA